jgi:hypothetical protein
MPDGCCSLIINLHQDATRIYDPDSTCIVTKSNGSGLRGPHTKCFTIDTEEQGCVDGVSSVQLRGPFSQAPSLGITQSVC